MKRALTRIVVVSAVLAVASSAAFAHEDYSEANATTHWLGHIAASPNQPSERQLAPYGYAVPGTLGRTVVIGKDTPYLNVVQLETVVVRMGDKTVNWMFDTLGRTSFPLSKIIPGVEGVTVYVAENPMYQGGS